MALASKFHDVSWASSPVSTLPVFTHLSDIPEGKAEDERLGSAVQLVSVEARYVLENLPVVVDGS